MKKSLLAFLIPFLFVIGCNSGGETAKTTDETTEQAAPPVQETVVPVPAENPPHGEPGHVHDEGAPADAGTGTGTVTPQGDVKLNPPHGEPGHRCDVAVGAPLPM